ncbi:proteoglycan 4 [Frankliniella occidentalis]|uniref:Proteoglycan 4 n=1 Tax=Frankliniella occidentalis TaxID=133901 RepID=A0A6J1SAN1_FRAOC|nr:proteoglycan 4 [Frankliniella occidentalis]
MTALRIFVVLLAVSAACASHGRGKISGSVRATSVQRAVNVATKHIDSQIAEISNYGVITDVIDEGLEKLNELVKKIQERVEHAEEDLIKAVKKAAKAVAENLDKLIEKATGIDFNLEDKLEDFEEKTENCAEELKNKVLSTLLTIKKDAETCAAPQIEEAQKLAKEIRELIELIESVPVNTVNSVKQCVRGEEPTTTAAPEPSTTAAPEPSTTAAPESTTGAQPESTTGAQPESTTGAEPESTTAAQPESTTAAESDSTDNDVVVFNFNKRSVRSISDVFEKVKCVAEALANAASDLKDAPKLVYYLDKQIRDLANKETQNKLKKCAAKAVAGKSKELQKDAAELAYCIIAPKDD